MQKLTALLRSRAWSWDAARSGRPRWEAEGFKWTAQCNTCALNLCLTVCFWLVPLGRTYSRTRKCCGADGVNIRAPSGRFVAFWRDAIAHQVLRGAYRRDEIRRDEKERFKNKMANLNLPKALSYIGAYDNGNPMATPKAGTCILTKVHATLKFEVRP